MDDVDRQDFLKTLAEACQKTGWQVHAYCLMRNHFHLVVETPNANLVEGMRWLLERLHDPAQPPAKLFGHVFSGRYKALLVEGSGNGYLKTACDYVHLNPVRAQLLGTEDRLLAYPWSSLAGIWRRRSIGPAGCGWTACWASTGFRDDRGGARRNSSAGWRHGGWRKATRKR